MRKLLFSSKCWGDGIITRENCTIKLLQPSAIIAMEDRHCNFLRSIHEICFHIIGVCCDVFAIFFLSWLYILIFLRKIYCLNTNTQNNKDKNLELKFILKKNLSFLMCKFGLYTVALRWTKEIEGNVLLHFLWETSF